jgi:hypothetical protein
MRVSEPKPGPGLQKADTGSSLLTAFSVRPEGTAGSRSSPRNGRVAEELRRLDRYARERADT